MNPADLKPGHRITHTVPKMTGIIAVYAEPWADIEGDPHLDRVYVDVEVSDASYATSHWDPEDLPAGTGAEAFTWLGLSPLRYRLTFLPDADVSIDAAQTSSG